MSQTPAFIQAVPWIPERAVNAVRTAEQTGGTVVWDEHRSPLETWILALDRMGEGPALLLEDDVQLAPLWRIKVEAVIEEHPAEVIQFFTTANELAGWQEGHHFAGFLCTYFPPGLAAEVRGHLGEKRPKFAQGYHDLWFGRWLEARGRRYWLHQPSLVQHHEWRSVVMPNRSRTRQSPSYRYG